MEDFSTVPQLSSHRRDFAWTSSYRSPQINNRLTGFHAQWATLSSPCARHCSSESCGRRNFFLLGIPFDPLVNLDVGRSCSTFGDLGVGVARETHIDLGRRRVYDGPNAYALEASLLVCTDGFHDDEMHRG